MLYTEQNQSYIITLNRSIYTTVYGRTKNVSIVSYFFNQTPRLLFFSLLIFLRLLFEGGIYFFADINDGWIRYVRVILLKTATTVRHYQLFAQPLSPAVSRGNESYYTNSPSASLVTVVRKYSQASACAAYSSCSYYLRAAFISLRASDCAATIQGQRLFEAGVYSKQYSIWLCTHTAFSKLQPRWGLTT